MCRGAARTGTCPILSLCSLKIRIQFQGRGEEGRSINDHRQVGQKSSVTLKLCCRIAENVGRASFKVTRQVGRRLYVGQKEKIQSQRILLDVGGLDCQPLMLCEMWEQL